tara:strand:- start:683 stop:1066 length:384 start_codon:yes stop_codon:yes gene_type:complete
METPLQYKFEKATTIRHEGCKTIVQLYETDIVSFEPAESDSAAYPHYKVTLNTGEDEDGKGHWTQLTKRRINQASVLFNLGFEVRQRKGKWYVETMKGGGCITITSFGPEGSGAEHESNTVTFGIVS